MPATFSCQACGKQYPWKPEYAGRKVKCKCGAVMTAPAEPDSDGADLDALAGLASGGGGYDVAESQEEPPKAKRARPAPPPAVAAAAVAMPRPGVGPLAYQSAQAKNAEGEKKESALTQATRDVYLPLGLIALGVILSMIESRYVLGSFSTGSALVYVFISNAINVVMMFIALMVMVKLFDVGLGPVGPALLKVAAVAMAPGAIGGIISHLFMGGSYVGWVVQLLLIWWLLWLLFQMDFQEVTMCTAIIWLIRNFVGTFVVVALLAVLFGGIGRHSKDDDLAGGPGIASGRGGSRAARPGNRIAADPDDDEDALDNPATKSRRAMAPIRSADGGDGAPAEGAATGAAGEMKTADGEPKPDGEKPAEGEAPPRVGPEDDLRAPVDIPPVGAASAAASQPATQAAPADVPPAAPPATPAADAPPAAPAPQ